MGGVDLDLRAATLDLAGGSIDVNATIGGVQITVPSGWAVDLERHVVAGGVDARVAARELMPTTLPPFVCGLSRGWAESWSRPVRARDVRRRSRAAAVQAIPAAGRDSTLGAMTSLPAPRRTPPRRRRAAVRCPGGVVRERWVVRDGCAPARGCRWSARAGEQFEAVDLPPRRPEVAIEACSGCSCSIAHRHARAVSNARGGAT
jgi:hypothetical protein